MSTTVKRILIWLTAGCILIQTVYANGRNEADANQRKLVINSNHSDAVARAGFNTLVENFDRAYPEIEVTLNVFDHESYKTAIRNFLVSNPPDISLWFAGNRMRFFVKQGLFADVSNIWAENKLDKYMASSKSALTVDGRQYGIPMDYYQWGIYYRRDIFDKYGLSEPETWDELIEISAALKANEITPFSIGTRGLWPAAGWFDYINLRVNGMDYHMKLMNGAIRYTDSRLDEVFRLWGNLVKNDYFLKNHASYDWREAQVPLIEGKAAMYLMGNFIMPDLEIAGIGDKMDFFQFPIIDSSVGIFEEAPIDTYHIPSGAKHMEEARIFLNYVSQPEVQASLAYAGGLLPTHSESEAPTERFTKKGFKMLQKAEGLTQFYDRDTNPEMAKAGMQGFQEFMVVHGRELEIRKKMEAERKKIFGPAQMNE